MKTGSDGTPVPPISIHAPVAETMLVRTAASDGIFIVCYENAVPPFIEAELERLYGNIFSTLAEISIYRGNLENINTFVAYKGADLASVLLFERNATSVKVINEGVRINSGELQQFADYIFGTYGSVRVISLHAVESEIGMLCFPKQCFNCLEDIVLTLPNTMEEYRAGLGKATRSYMNRYLNKLRRAFPSLRHKVYARQEIQEKHVRDIIHLNNTRMTEKGKIPEKDDKDELALQRVFQLAKACGMVSILEIDGKVCAGTINYQAGDNYFLDVIAHDSEYNDYRLGTLCCYFTISECIARHGKEYHFLWGQNEYKFRLGGVRRGLNHLAIYRSRKHMILNGGMVLKNAVRRYERQAHLWVQANRHRDGLIPRFSNDLMCRLRKWRLHRASRPNAGL
jgi:hypothetical protein